MAKPTPVKEVTFDVDDVEDDSYETFMSKLRDTLAGTAGENVHGHPVLDKGVVDKDDEINDNLPPPQWIYVVLDCGGGTPKVAIRSDNAYIVGFSNGQGKWFQLDNTGKKVILPDATATLLGFSGHYSDLVGEPEVNLPKLKLGMANTLNAATVLWNHGKKKDATASDDNDDDDGGGINGNGDAGSGVLVRANDPQANLKKALATLAVTLCEGARLIPVHDVVASGWWGGSEHAGAVDVKQVQYINKWGQLSKAMLGWNKDGSNGWFKYVKDSTGIGNGTQALAVVQLLLNNPPAKTELLRKEEYLAAQD